jgi:hypothetical protein
MTFMKTAGRLAAVVALLAVFSVDAAAQVPGLTATANGRSVTIDITPVSGSTGHRLVVGTTPGGADIVVNLPLSVTHIVVAAPDATYYLRVAAMLGTLVGPFGQEVTVVVTQAPPPPPPGCQPPSAPTVTATGNGLSASVSWTPVAGAIGYAVHWSRSPGGTELVETTGGTSVTKYVGVAGTFFVRVFVQTACGSATSAEQTFTLVNTPGNGPRTPNPPPGQLLPIPDYARSVVEDVGRRYAGELARHSGPNCKNENSWLFRLLYELRLRDSRWGLNWKRGWPGTMSTDVITYNGTDGPDDGATHVYLADVLSGECETNYPVFNWEGITDATWTADRNNPGLCNNRDCARWTLEPYLLAGYPR